MQVALPFPLSHEQWLCRQHCSLQSPEHVHPLTITTTHASACRCFPPLTIIAKRCRLRQEYVGDHLPIPRLQPYSSCPAGVSTAHTKRLLRPHPTFSSTHSIANVWWWSSLHRFSGASIFHESLLLANLRTRTWSNKCDFSSKPFMQ